MISHTGTGDLSTSLASRNLDKGTSDRAVETVEAPVGHVARIGSTPADEFERPVFAAGAVLWRRTSPDGPGTPETAGGDNGDEIEIAVIHRPHYDDWSLPKGKVDPGENMVATATREIAEETGYSPTLGWLLGYIHYPLGNKTKVVYYWTAEVTDGRFQDNNEVDELHWLSPTTPRRRSATTRTGTSSRPPKKSSPWAAHGECSTCAMLKRCPGTTGKRTMISAP